MRVACPDCNGAGRFFVQGRSLPAYWESPDDQPHTEMCEDCEGEGEIEDYSEEASAERARLEALMTHDGAGAAGPNEREEPSLPPAPKEQA